MTTATWTKAIFQPRRTFGAAILLRVVLLVYGHYQDQYSALKYTDIDYYVFTDASRYTYHGDSPYARDTYRYTPLLAWLLLPTAWGGLWFDFGKVLFASSDIVAGYLAYAMLNTYYSMSTQRALQYASIWLLNPMVAQISTRGSSEGVLAAMVMGLLWACLNKLWASAGVLLGISVHFKIYPFIYAAAIIWWLDESQIRSPSHMQHSENVVFRISSFLNLPRLKVAAWSLVTFVGLNLWMFYIYGQPFLQHTYFYHVIRSDHRHNFSIYNMLLYIKASPASSSTAHIESFAFVPQLALVLVILPWKLAKNDLASCMLAQTFAFVASNKVCTSQYFLWYMIFLPFYLSQSSMTKSPKLGLSMLGAWILGQVAWLQQGYVLEFLGQSSFVPGMFIASLSFFCINVAILGIIIQDIRQSPARSSASSVKTD